VQTATVAEATESAIPLSAVSVIEHAEFTRTIGSQAHRR